MIQTENEYENALSAIDKLLLLDDNKSITLEQLADLELLSNDVWEYEQKTVNLLDDEIL